MTTNIKELILSKMPVKQSDLAKALNVDRRIVSKVVIALEKANLIKRTKVSQSGITTYLIQKNVTRNVTDTFKLSQLNPKYKTLMNDRKEFSPCTACFDECKPPTCEKIVNWIL